MIATKISCAVFAKFFQMREICRCEKWLFDSEKFLIMASSSRYQFFVGDLAGIKLERELYNLVLSCFYCLPALFLRPSGPSYLSTNSGIIYLSIKVHPELLVPRYAIRTIESH